jgi:hypothetical protein
MALVKPPPHLEQVIADRDPAASVNDVHADRAPTPGPGRRLHLCGARARLALNAEERRVLRLAERANGLSRNRPRAPIGDEVGEQAHVRASRISSGNDSDARTVERI